MGRALQLQVQGQWTRWENYIKNDLSWKSILAMSPHLLSFCLASTYDVLPSPSNLKRWNVCTESACALCSKQVCTTAHVLGACKVALSQGRFTFRHDAVLRGLLLSLERFSSEVVPETKKHLKVSFVKAGSYSSAKRSKPTGLFHHASDWVILADLNEGFVFPGHIAITSLRPDIVIYSNCSKRIIIIELTCPCEENMGSWHSTKLSKYFPLVEVIRSNGWFPHLFAVEVGARGYSSRSLTCCLKSLGFASKSAFLTARKLGDISMKASFCIWIARDSPQWSQDLTHCSPPTFATTKG